MADYNQLKTRAQQVRDEQTIGGNTALRVGQLLMDMVDAESETVDNIVELFTGTEDNPVIPTLPNPGLLHWLQSPIVALVSMGEDLDGDAGAVVQEGDLYYYNHSGFQIFVKGSGGSIGVGYKARKGVLFINKYTGKFYEWTGSFMSEITIPGSGGGGGGGGDITVDSALSLSSNNPVKNKVITAALSAKQDTLTFDNAPTANSNNPVQSGGVYTALDAKANAADVPTNQDMADAIDDALGEAQVAVVPAGSVGIISSLGSDSNSDALSASMGKKLKAAIITVLNSLGNYAFPDGKPLIDWADDTPVTYTVSKTIGSGLSATGGDTDVALDDSLEVTIAITNNMYIVDDDSVVVTMGGQPVAGAWNASTMKVTIAAVTGAVVINIPSITYFDVDGANNHLAFMLDCKNRGGQEGHWIDLIGGKDFTLTDVTEADTGMVFNGSTSKGVASGYINVLQSAGTIEIIGTRANNTDTAPFLINILENGICAMFSVPEQNKKICQMLTASSAVPENISIRFDNTDIRLSANRDSVVVNGAAITPTWEDYRIAMSQVLSVGYRQRSGTNQFLNGTIKAIRVYNSKLTLQQQIENYKVDQKRFNLL